MHCALSIAECLTFAVIAVVGPGLLCFVLPAEHFRLLRHFFRDSIALALVETGADRLSNCGWFVEVSAVRNVHGAADAAVVREMAVVLDFDKMVDCEDAVVAIVDDNMVAKMIVDGVAVVVVVLVSYDDVAYKAIVVGVVVCGMEDDNQLVLVPVRSFAVRLPFCQSTNAASILLN